MTYRRRGYGLQPIECSGPRQKPPPPKQHIDLLDDILGGFGAASIVQALAAVDEPLDYEFDYCRLCTPMGGPYHEGHTTECPWRRARDWVAAHPRSDI